MILRALLVLSLLAASGCATGNHTRAYMVTPISLVNWRSATIYLMPLEGTSSSNAMQSLMQNDGGGKVDATIPLKEKAQ